MYTHSLVGRHYYKEECKEDSFKRIYLLKLNLPSPLFVLSAVKRRTAVKFHIFARQFLSHSETPSFIKKQIVHGHFISHSENNILLNLALNCIDKL